MVELLSTDSSSYEYKRVHCMIVFIVFHNVHLKKNQQTTEMALSKQSIRTNSKVSIHIWHDIFTYISDTLTSFRLQTSPTVLTKKERRVHN